MLWVEIVFPCAEDNVHKTQKRLLSIILENELYRIKTIPTQSLAFHGSNGRSFAQRKRRTPRIWVFCTTSHTCLVNSDSKIEWQAVRTNSQSEPTPCTYGKAFGSYRRLPCFALEVEKNHEWSKCLKPCKVYFFPTNFAVHTVIFAQSRSLLERMLLIWISGLEKVIFSNGIWNFESIFCTQRNC